MSKSQAIAFFEEISKNKQLAKEVEKVVGGKNSDEAKAKELISLAKKHKFNFTKKEAASAKGALTASLSPEEMLEVSGGKSGLKSSFMAMALLAGLGVSGAAMSSTETSAMNGGNHQEIQVPAGQAAEQQQEGNAQPGQQQQGADGNQEQPGQQNAAAQAEQPPPWVFYGPFTVDAGNFIEVQGPGDLHAIGDDGFVVVPGGRSVHVLGPGEGLVGVTGDRTLVVDNPGERGVFVNGDRTLVVSNPGERAIFVDGDRALVVNNPGKRVIFVNGARTVQASGAGALFVNRPGGRTAGQPAEIYVAPPELLNPGRDPQEAPVYAPRDVALNDARAATINNAQLVNIYCACPVTHSGPGGDLLVTGDALLRTEGNNHITAGANSHIVSFSSNEINHQGLGPVNIDGGGIKIGTLDNDLLTRTVEITEATSVTVNRGITIRTQNDGTEFTLGATREETIDNLIPDQQELPQELRRRHQRNRNVNDPQLQKFLAFAMQQFDISPEELCDYLKESFCLPHIK